MSCCCSPIVCQCYSEPHQSQTSVSVQHGQPPSPLLSSPSLPMRSSSLYLLSPSPHMKACLTYACQGNILQHEDENRRERGDFQIRPMMTQTKAQKRNYTHQFPLHGPERVIEGEGLVTPTLHRRPVSCRLCPLGTCKHTDLSCVYVCM